MAESLDDPISSIGARDETNLITVSDYERAIELPVLAPCLKLRELGIRTIASTANAKDINSGVAAIGIERKSLAAINDQKFRDLALRERDKVQLHDNYIQLNIPIASAHTTAGEISTAFCELIDKANLKRQPAFWVEWMELEDFLIHKSFFARAFCRKCSRQRRMKRKVLMLVSKLGEQ